MRTAMVITRMLAAIVASSIAFAACAHAGVPYKRIAGGNPDEPTTWVVSKQPETLWSDKPLASTLVADGPASTFGSASAPASTFELADVPPERLAATRAMLDDLDARSSDGAIVVDLPGDVLFDFDKDTLRPDAVAVLSRVGVLLAGFPRRAVAIQGHTDSKGDDDYNDALSERRANRVHAFLAGRDTTPREYDVEGFGERQPVAPNATPDGRDDPAGRQKNRRVAIVIRPPDT